MLLRDMPLTVIALEERILITCSVPITPSTAGGVGGVGISSTANSIVSSSGGLTGISGRIIDRLASDLTTRYNVALPQAFLQSTRGSTEASRQLTLGIKLQHGDSSGGGDMADYSTGNQPADRVLFTTARTSDMAIWDSTGSTGPIAGVSTLPAHYDIRAAKRFIRAVVFAQKNLVTTETSGDEGARVHAVVTFAAGNETPQNAASTSAWSTSTST